MFSRFRRKSVSKGRFAGDVAISAEIAAQNARRLGHSPAEEVKVLVLHGLLHLAGYDHEPIAERWRDREMGLRKQLELPVALIERERRSSAAETSRSRTEARAMNYAVVVVLLLLLGLLTLVSYVDRLYTEIGKFLSREFQDNIDSFEKQVEPRLRVSRHARVALHGDPGASCHGRDRACRSASRSSATRRGAFRKFCRRRSA